MGYLIHWYVDRINIKLLVLSNGKINFISVAIGIFI